MKKIVIFGIVALLVVGSVAAGQMYKPFSFLETKDLSVLRNSFFGIGGNMRVDSNLHVNGELSIDGLNTFSGECPSSWVAVYRKGLAVDCVGPQ